MSPTHQDLSNDTTFSQIKSCVPVPLINQNFCDMCRTVLYEEKSKVKMCEKCHDGLAMYTWCGEPGTA